MKHKETLKAVLLKPAFYTAANVKAHLDSRQTQNSATTRASNGNALSCDTETKNTEADAVNLLIPSAKYKHPSPQELTEPT